jgi:uncharacterized membrane protein YkvA (DUF1232 family)
MNHALKQDLKKLASLPGDPGMAAFRALIKLRAGDQAAWVEKSLRSMIIMMPELLERVRRQSSGPGMPEDARRLYARLLTYLYEPRDVIPEDGNGFFGYADDAYLVSAAYERTLPPEEDRTQVRAWLETARWILPAETAQLDRILDELVTGKTEAYDAVFDPKAAS